MQTRFAPMPTNGVWLDLIAVRSTVRDEMRAHFQLLALLYVRDRIHLTQALDVTPVRE